LQEKDRGAGDFRPRVTPAVAAGRGRCFENEDDTDVDNPFSSAVEPTRLLLTDADRRVLTAWIRAGKTPQRVVRRTRIVLLVAEGRSMRDVAAQVGASTRSVALWRRRFEGGGPAALLADAPGRGRKATVTNSARQRLGALLAMPPPASRWTVRALAAAGGISAASVHRILKAGKVTLGAELGSRTGGRARQGSNLPQRARDR
jgi:transposase